MENVTETAEKAVLLPQSAQELDEFVAGIISEFALPEGDDTYEMIATAILHLDHKIAFKERSYFANYIRKALANKYAYEWCSAQLKKREVKKAEEDARNKTTLTIVESEAPPVGAEPLQNA